MGLLTRPTLLVEIYLAKYPASLGTQTLRFTRSSRSVSMAGAFYQPRIKSMGRIRRMCSDADGNYEIGSASFVIDDRDVAISALTVAGTSTEYWLNREVGIWVISQEGITAGLTTATTVPVFRGIITDVQPRDWEVHVTCSSLLGSMMSRANLDKKVLRTRIKDLTDRARDEDKDTAIPLYLGEFSDRGAVDKDGNPAVRGLVPVHEVCEIDITDLTGVPIPAPAGVPVLNTPVVTGDTGEETIFYGATFVTPLGESGMSNIVSASGASFANRKLSLGNYTTITGTAPTSDPSNPSNVRIWVGPSADNMIGYLDMVDLYDPATGAFGYIDGAYPYPTPTRDEIDVVKRVSPPAPAAETNMNLFSIMAICLGYDYEILDLYASDLADGAEPKRLEIQAAEHGMTTITSDDPEWPFPNPWIEMNGIIFTGFLQRGLKLNHHRERSVTFSANICGPHLSGLLLDQAMRQLAFLFNEYCFKNKGKGWANQTYDVLETFENGDSVVDRESFEASGNLTEVFLGTEKGYLGNIYVIDPEETWRDVIRKAAVSFGCRFTENRFGQLKVLIVNTAPDVSVDRHFKEKIEIKRSEPPRLLHGDVVTAIKWSYFFDPTTTQFRGRDYRTENLDAAAAQIPGGISGQVPSQGVHEKTIEIHYSAYAETATDVINRELMRRQRRTRYVPKTVGLMGLDHDNGDRARETDRKTGDVNRQVRIFGHETDLDHEEVLLDFLDIDSILGLVPHDDEDSEALYDQVGDDDEVPPTSWQVGDNDAIPPTSRQVG